MNPSQRLPNPRNGNRRVFFQHKGPRTETLAQGIGVSGYSLNPLNPTNPRKPIKHSKP